MLIVEDGSESVAVDLGTPKTTKCGRLKVAHLGSEWDDAVQ